MTDNKSEIEQQQAINAEIARVVYDEMSTRGLEGGGFVLALFLPNSEGTTVSYATTVEPIEHAMDLIRDARAAANG